MELGYFNKHLSKANKKQDSAGKNLELFLLHDLKTTFLFQRWTQLGHLISKIKALFWIFKKGKDKSPCNLSSCAPKLLCNALMRERGDRVSIFFTGCYKVYVTEGNPSPHCYVPLCSFKYFWTKCLSFANFLKNIYLKRYSK